MVVQQDVKIIDRHTRVIDADARHICQELCGDESIADAAHPLCNGGTDKNAMLRGNDQSRFRHTGTKRACLET